MICYLNGIIKNIYKDAVIIDVHDVGYHALVSHPQDLVEGEKVLLYTYEVTREDEHYLVGFTSKEEFDVFNMLIKVKGLGPKTVINALSATTPNEVLTAISSNNVVYFKHLPGIGAKAAGQIILDLKGELTGEKGNPKVYDDVADALKNLGFKMAAIERVLQTINEPNATSEEVLKLALIKLRK